MPTKVGVAISEFQFQDSVCSLIGDYDLRIVGLDGIVARCFMFMYSTV